MTIPTDDDAVNTIARFFFKKSQAKKMSRIEQDRHESDISKFFNWDKAADSPDRMLVCFSQNMQ